MVEHKITPEMVDAGVEALTRLDLSWEPYERIVKDVYFAMFVCREAAPPGKFDGELDLITTS